MRNLVLGITLCVCMPLYSWAEDCSFDTDDADAPDFANRIGKCQQDSERSGLLDILRGSANKKNAAGYEAVYKNDSEAAEEGELIDTPIGALGFRQHIPGKGYVVREPYSLLRGARFEESVTLAIHRLHLQMAQYCGQGWSLDKEWTSANIEPGHYFLHYAFTCSGMGSSERRK